MQLPPRPADAEQPPWLRFATPVGGGLGVSDEATVQKASQIKDLLELTVRRRELQAVVTRVLSDPPQGQDSSSFSLPETPLERLHSAPLPAPPQLPPLTVPERSQEDAGQAPSMPKGEAGDEMHRFAAKIGARLQCVDALRTEEPDPVELKEALTFMKEMNLASEDCGQAVLAHAHRLSMKAEDAVSSERAGVPAIEAAVNLLEAVKSEVPAAPKVLEKAGKKLLNAHELRRQVGIRCIFGGHARMFSVWRSASLSDLLAKVAEVLRRPVKGLDPVWGQLGQPLRTEEQWQSCLAAHARGPIEIFVAAGTKPLPAGGRRVKPKSHSLLQLKVATGRMLGTAGVRASSHTAGSSAAMLMVNASSADHRREAIGNFPVSPGFPMSGDLRTMVANSPHGRRTRRGTTGGPEFRR